MKVIKCSPREYEQNHRKYQGLLNKESHLNHVPNSLGGLNYVQFMVIIDRVETVFYIDNSQYPNYKRMY